LASCPLIKAVKLSLNFSIVPSAFLTQTFSNKEIMLAVLSKAAWPSFFFFHSLILASVKTVAKSA
jgi:hypothetical protein